MSLAKDYCKELLRELDQLPVYLPGRNVSVGDVITFGPIGIFNRPIGDFQLVTKLQSLNIDIQSQLDESLDSYRFASSGGTSISFEPDVDAGSVGKGTLSVNFSKTGSIYLAALDCSREDMTNVHTLEKQLAKLVDVVDWNNCYIVTSVTRASRAIVMQSNSSSAELVIKGETQILNPSVPVPIDAGLNFSVQSYKDSAFMKDWSNETPLFMTLVRYKRNIFGDWKFGMRPSALYKANSVQPNGITYKIVSVSKEEILEEAEVMV